METELISCLQGRKQQLWKDFLSRAGLEADTQAEATVLVWDDGTLIATGSRQGNLLKCIAVDEGRQGQGLTATVLTRLRQDSFAAGHRHLFLYTKPKNLLQFSSLFFYPVAQTDKVLLMEDQPGGITRFLDTLPVPCKEGRIGALVMNCNPFTLGHRYLMETAAKECDWVYVFILSEDKSEFSAADRLMLVKEGTQDLKNVTVLPTGPYLISSATFPTYFLKEQTQTAQCALDVEIFRKYFIPKFGITVRYVGTEPLCPITSQYNEALRRQLPIPLKEIPRLTREDVPISASAVRALLCTGQADAVQKLVPPTTFAYLQSHDLL